MPTAIEWTDETWNPIRGTVGRHTCVKVSPGCEHCYAERLNVRFGGPRYVVGADTPRLDEEVLTQPLHWKRPRRIFVCSMSDLFQEDVPETSIAKVFGTMALAESHTFQVLTKRPERMRRLLSDIEWVEYVSCHALDRLNGTFFPWPLPNVWLGVSAENQQYADERIPLLLQTPAAVRFVSCEPLLGPIDLRPYFHGWQPHDPADDHAALRPIQWVIVGGESGGPPQRRLVVRVSGSLAPRHWNIKPDAHAWVSSLRDQCQAAGAAFFFKQWGGPTPKAGGRMLGGREWSEYPR